MAGCGLIGKHHYVPAIRNSKNAELLGIAASAEKKAAEFAKEMNIPNAYPDFDEMLKDPLIEAVIVGTPNYLHYQQVIDAANAGKHVLCEKPMAMNLTQSLEMVKACEEHNVTLMVAHHLRFKKCTQEVRNILAKGELGRISTCRAQWSFNGPRDTMNKNWHDRKDLSGGGQAMNVNSHCVDLLVYLFGPPNKVSAMMAQDASCEIEHTSVITIEFKSGVIGIAHGSNHEDGSENNLEIFGSAGGLIVQGACSTDNHAIMKRTTSHEIIDLNSDETPYMKEIEHFCSAIREEYEPISSGRRVLDTMRILMAAYESAQNGKHERVE